MGSSVRVRAPGVARLSRVRLLVAAAAASIAVGAIGAPTLAAPATAIVAESAGNSMGAQLVGAHPSSSVMGIQLVLAPRDARGMDRFIASLTNPRSPNYHHWLATGQFARRFGPTSATISAARSFLARAGLRLESSPSPFLVRASGPTARVEQAFATRINDYRPAKGPSFYTNSSAVSVPRALAGRVTGVMGLSNTVRLHSNYKTTAAAAKAAGKATPKYGGGPGGSGLTPAQIEGIYSAGTIHALPNGRGEGTSLGLLELSGYTHKDIRNYEKRFFGSSVDVPLVDVYVDGGPIHPECPTGDNCGPFDDDACADGCSSADYSGDIEVEADIEVQIAMAPKADKLLVYNAPNDFLGLTFINMLFRMANDNEADVISSSWGLCEPEDTLSTAQAEYVAFAQMAAQGQSFFASAGDAGAFDCYYDPDNHGLQVDDAASQPYVTAVGGTSMGTFDPGSDQSVSYPDGHETVWNPLNSCQRGAGKQGCADFGAGGGGVSRFWPRPPYQKGPGVAQPGYTRKGPFCSEARDGQRCREVPDVSANADQYTPYAEVCTGDKTVSGAGASYCHSFVDDTSPRGWFGIGGTSLSSPLWSAVVDLAISYHGERLGQANVMLYELFRSPGGYSTYFHDITGIHQTETNNGWYPVRPNYDMATGIGTPNVSAIAMAP